MRTKANTYFLIIFFSLIFLVFRLIINQHIVNIDNIDIYNYRVYTLKQNQVDEHGFKIPLIFQSRLGYELPLTTYSYLLINSIINSSQISAVVFDIIITIFVGISFAYLTSSLDSFLFIVFCPYFLWPGNWTEKIFITLTFLAIKLINENKYFQLIFLELMLLCTSIYSVPLILIFNIDIIKQKQLPILKYLIPSTVLLIIFLVSFLQLPYSKSFLLSKNINYLNDIETVNATNQLRGEDNSTKIYMISRLLHNKLSQIYSVAANSVRVVDPSLWFFNRNEDQNSSRQLTPVYISLYILLIFITPINKKIKSTILPLIISIMFVSLNGLPTQQTILIAIPFYLIFLHSNYLVIPTKIRYVFIVISIITMIPLIKISYDFHPKSIYKYSSYYSTKITEYLKINSNKNLFITDDIYPDLGPQLSNELKITSKVNKLKYYQTYEPYVRNISDKIKIISPDDPNILISNQQNIFLISPNLYKEIYTKTSGRLTPAIYSNQGEIIFYQLTYEGKSK